MLTTQPTRGMILFSCGTSCSRVGQGAIGSLNHINNEFQMENNGFLIGNVKHTLEQYTPNFSCGRMFVVKQSS